MGQFLKLFFMSATVFLVFDLIWLLIVSNKMYQQFIGHLMGEVKIIPAILFYLIYIIGIVFFVLLPGIEKNRISFTLFSGALFGFICYATYDLTNFATLTKWPIKMVIIDLLWGTAVTAITSGIVYIIQANCIKGM